MEKHCTDSCHFDHIWGHREMGGKGTRGRIALAVTNDLIIPSIRFWK